MVNRLAVAVDGSPASWAAVQYAVDAVDQGGLLLLIDVQDVKTFYNDCTSEAVAGDLSCDVRYFMKAWDKAAEHAQQEAMQIASMQGVEVEWRIVKLPPNHGRSPQAFYEAAIREHVDLLVTGKHHGLQLLEGLFGSFPRWLLLHSQTPVAVVPPSAVH
ncbi:universal stress protein [Ferrimicrobium sp.]|uniref:universal stress protein n=1 Tax=Ferrimicrobium sp. TaxID=2926050 RepID=UPI0026227310|nr:universal stress protein [Ferrimicrobium sp.]